MRVCESCQDEKALTYSVYCYICQECSECYEQAYFTAGESIYRVGETFFCTECKPANAGLVEV